MPLILLAALGGMWLLLRRPRVAALLLAALFIQLFAFFNYEIWDLYVFYIPSYVLLGLIAIAGMGALIEMINWGLDKLSGRQAIHSTLLDIILAILVLLFAVWPILQPRQEDLIAGEVSFKFDEYPAYNPNLKLIAAATVADLPQKAIVFTSWDMMWPYYYAAHLESDRSDLAFIEAYPADDQDIIADSLVEYVLDNLGEQPMFFESRISQLEQIENISMGPRRVGPTRFFSVIEIEQ
jgi:hypothetical protein